MATDFVVWDENRTISLLFSALLEYFMHTAAHAYLL